MSPEQLDPKRYHTLDPKNRKIVVAILLFIGLVILPLLSLAYYKAAVKRPSQTADEVTIKIESGASVSEVSSSLYANDIINSEFLFKFYVVVNNLQEKIQAGTYVIPAGTNMVDVTAMLLYGRDDIPITFLEGWRVEQFAKHASDVYEKIDYSDFVEMAKGQEGMLFPDTYSFNVDVTERELLDTLRNNFESKTKEILTSENLERAGLTKKQAVIFASIVEREVRTEEDKALVAGILIKRWQEDTLIGADATTQYIVAAGRYGCALDEEKVCPNEEEIPNVEWWPDKLTVTELELENPYNTRAAVGLPPGPISNPGVSSMSAVVNYTPSDYYYYLTDSDGVTHYARTLEEHNNNIATFL